MILFPQNQRPTSGQDGIPQPLSVLPSSGPPSENFSQKYILESLLDSSSQKALAQDLGCPRQRISEVVNGHRRELPEEYYPRLVELHSQRLLARIQDAAQEVNPEKRQSDQEQQTQPEAGFSLEYGMESERLSIGALMDFLGLEHKTDLYIAAMTFLPQGKAIKESFSLTEAAQVIVGHNLRRLDNSNRTVHIEGDLCAVDFVDLGTQIKIDLVPVLRQLHEKITQSKGGHDARTTNHTSAVCGTHQSKDPTLGSTPGTINPGPRQIS